MVLRKLSQDYYTGYCLKGLYDTPHFAVDQSQCNRNYISDSSLLFCKSKFLVLAMKSFLERLIENVKLQ